MAVSEQVDNAEQWGVQGTGEARAGDDEEGICVRDDEYRVKDAAARARQRHDGA